MAALAGSVTLGPTSVQASDSHVAADAKPAVAGCGQRTGSVASGITRGERLISTTRMSVCASGTVTIDFHGDTATGCAARGLCGYQGSESWSAEAPPGALGFGSTGLLDIDSVSFHGRRAYSATLFFGGIQPLRARVSRSGSAATCTDRFGQGPGAINGRVKGGQLTLGLGGPESWIGTRCAGPLQSDVASALPRVTVPLRPVLNGEQTINLAMTKGFAHGGFAGTVTSTLVLRLGRATTKRFAPNKPRKRDRLREVSVDYRIVRVAGVVRARVHADGGTCAQFDACGLSGTIELRPRLKHDGFAEIFSSGPVSRPYPDLPGSLGLTHRLPLPKAVYGPNFFGSWTDAGAAAAHLHQPGLCRDRAQLLHGFLDGRVAQGVIKLGYDGLSSGVGPLRTRCPGPMLGRHPLAAGSVRESTLGQPHVKLRLDGGERFRNGPYTITTTSSLTLTLRRTRISRRTV
jgi:hypothetical protein